MARLVPRCVRSPWLTGWRVPGRLGTATVLLAALLAMGPLPRPAAAQTTISGTTTLAATLSGAYLLDEASGAVLMTGTSALDGVVTFAFLASPPTSPATLAADLGGTGSLEFSGPGTLVITGSNSYSGGTVVDDGGVLEVTTGGSISHDGADVVVGRTSASATLAITGGSIVSRDGVVGADGGGVGAVTMSAGSWTNTGTLYVGAGGSEYGGGTGSLLVTGGTVSALAGFLGYDADSAGDVTVSGGGTLSIAGNLSVGYSGSGTLSIGAGGTAIIGGTLGRGGAGTINLASGGTLQIGTGGVGGELGTDLANDGLVIFDQSSDSSYDYAMSGSGAVTKRGTGTLTISGSQTYAGLTTIDGGSLQLGDGIFTGSLAGDVVVGGGSLIFHPGSDLGYAGAISGTGGVIVRGNSVLTLSGSNSWSGGTTLQSGTLEVGGADALGTSGTIDFGGGVLRYSAGNQVDYSARIASAGGQTIAIDTNFQDVTFATGLAGAGTGLTKLGDGTLTLSGSNTYGGDTVAGAGTLQVTTGGSLGSAGRLLVGTVATQAGTFGVGGGVVDVASATIGSNDGTGTITVTSGSLAIGGALVVGDQASSAGTLHVSGGGVTAGSALLGATADASGSLYVDGGSFTTTGDLTVGGDGTGVLTVISAGTVAVDGTLSSGSRGTIALESGGTIRIGLGGSTGGLSGDLQNNGSLVFDRSTDSTYAGSLYGAGVVVKEGAGTLTLTGVNNWSGGTTVSAGTLQVGDGTAGSISGDVVNDATLAFGRTDDVNFAGSVTGSGSLRQVGTGTLTLGGASVYSGGTTVVAGTLAVTTGGSIDHATAPLTIGDGGTAAFVVSGGTVTSGDGIVGSGVSGDGSATIGAGLWTSTGDLVVGRNDATGLLSIEGGTLVVEGALTRGTGGTITLSSGGTLQIGNGGTGASLGTDLANDGALVFDGATTYGGTVSGTGTLAKRGSGTLTLSGSIGAAGGTAISGGTLDVVAGGLLGSAGADLLVGPDGSTGSLVVSGGAVSTNIGYVGYHGTGSATVSSGSWTNAGDLRIGWGLAGEPVTGPADGTFTLGGGSVSNLDAYVGAAAGSLGSATISDGSWVSGGALSIGWGGGSGSLDVTGGFVGAVDSRIGTGAGSTGTATVSAGVWANSGLLAVGDDGGSGTLTLTDGLVSSGAVSIGSGGGSTGTATVSGGIWQASGDMVVGNEGTGALAISGSGTVIVGGSLFKGAAGGLGGGGTITLASGGTLRIGSNGGNLATDLTDDGTLVFENSADGTYGGSIDGGGRVRIALSNAITLTLSGSNSWSGGTTLESGTLALSSPEALGPATDPAAGTIGFTGGTLQFSPGNTLDYSARFDATGAQSFRLDTNGQDVTLATALVGAASTLDKLGAGTLTLTADNTFTGLSTVASGTLRIGDGGLTGTLVGDVANDATLVFDRDGTLSFAGLITGTGTLVNQGPGRVELTGANAYSGSTILRAGTLALGSVGALGATDSISFEGGALAFTAANTLDSSALFSTAAGQTYRLDTGGQSVALAANLGTTGASLVKLGSGTLSLTGSSAFDAGTALVEGTLSLGSSGALGSAGTISFEGGTLAFTAANTLDSSARYSTAAGQAYRFDTGGQGVVLAADLGTTGASLVKFGSGTLTLTGSNAFDAGTSLVAGTLSLGSTGALGSVGTISFEGGTLAYTAANSFDSSARYGTAAGQAYRLDTDGVDVTLATGLSSDGGTLDKFGSGTLTLTGSNVYTGLTTVSAGTLRIGDGGTTGSLAGDIANDAALVFDRADASTYSGTLSGTGSVTKLGDGTLTLAGTNVFTGPLQIDAGTLALGSADALGAAGTISFGGGTLRYSASNQVDASGRISSAGAQAVRIDTAGEAVEFQSGISGGGSTLSKYGAGMLTLSGRSTYDAGTTVAGGTLDVVAGGAIAHATADFVAGTADGDGTLLVSGGSVSVADALLGRSAGAIGSVTVTSGTLDTAGTLVVGSAAGATGSLDLQGGGVTSAAATLGFAVGSSGTATVTGGTWTIAGDLRVGDGGSGTLALSGAGVTAVGGSLSQAAGSTIDLAPGGTLRIGLGGTGGQLLTDLVNHGTLVFDRSDASSFIYGVSGSGAVTKQGAGALILTGTIANPVTTISAGTLRVGDGLVDGVITGDVVDDASLEFDTAADVTFAGAISGTGTLAKLGGATLTLNGSNSWSGGTFIDAGTLALGGSDALGTSGTIAFGGGTLRYTAANQVDYSARISSADGQAIRIDTADQSVTYASGIAGAGSTLTVLGSGTLSLAGTNTFDGLTTVSGGVLRIGDGAQSGSIVGDVANAAGVVFDRSDDSSYGGSMSGTGTLEKLGAGTLSLTGANTLTGTATIRVGTLQIGDGGSSGSLDAPVVSDGVLAFNRSGSLAFTSSVTGSGSLLKLGTGTLTLTGTAGQSGGTTVDGGTLDVAAGGAIDHATGGIVVGGGGNTGTLGISGGSVTAATGAIGFEGTGTVALTSGTWTTLGAVAVGSGGVSPGDGAVVVSGGSVETDVVYVGLNVGGSGSMTLEGGSWVNHGALVIGHDGGTGSLAMSGGTLTTGSAALAGPTTLASATAIVTGGTWTTTGDLVVGSDDGTGSLAISTAGVVRIGGTLSRGTLGSVGLQGGGTLQIGLGGDSGDFVGDLVNDGTLVFDRSDDPVFSNVISGSGTLVKRGDGTLELTGSNGYSGGTSLQAGVLAIGGASAIGSAGTISFDGGVLRYTALTGADTDYSSRFGTAPGQAYKIDTNGLDVTLGAGLSSAGGTLTKYGTGTLTLTGSNTYTGLTSIDSGTLRIGDGVTTGSVAGDITIVNSTATLLFDPAAGTDTFFPGVISGTGSVTKLGAGTLVLASDNTYLGTTTVSAGTLRLGDGGTTGSIRGDIVDDGAVVFDRSDDVLFAGVIEGSGALTKLGAGTLTFTGSNTYAGPTTIASGTLRLGDGGVAGSITGDVANAGTLRIDRSDDVVLGGTISGTGALEQVGTGSLTLTGPNTFTGLTTIASGTLRVGDGGSAGSIVGDVANAGVLVFDRSDDTTYAGGVSGVGSVTKQGAGTLTLTGSSAFSGGTTILAGGLRVGDGLTAGSFSGDVVNDGTLVFDRSDASAFDGALSGSGSLGKEGAGTLVYTGDATHAGGTTIGAGTLQIGAGGTVGSLAGDVVANGTLAFARSDAVTFTGTISGTGGISQIGTGQLTLLADNTAIGPTTISSGTLALGDGGNQGSIAGDVSNAGTLVFNRSGDIVFAGAISGTGAITKLGTGALTLTGDNGDSGPLTIESGALRIGGGGTSGAYAGDLVNRSALVFDRSDDVTYAGAISGAGTVEKLGAGMLTLTGENVGGGLFSITTGTVRIGAASTTGSISGDIANAGTLVFDRSDDATHAGVISGTGAVTKQGAGMLTLTGDSTGAGPLTIASGTVRIGDGGTSGVYVGDIVTAGTLVIDRSGAVTLPGAISGTGDAILAGPGTVTLSGRNTSTGVTRVESGALVLTASDPFAAEAGLVIATGASVTNASGGGMTVRDLAVGGAITSTAGRIVSTGTLTGAGTIDGSVLSTGRFQGVQTITGDVAVTGTHAPGNSPGVQSIAGSLSYDLGGGAGPSVEWELAADTVSNSPVEFDQVLVGTNLSFTTATRLQLSFASAGSTVDWTDSFWDADRRWTIWQVAGTTTGAGLLSIDTENWLDAFGNGFSSIRPGAAFTVGTGANGNDVVLNYVVAVPEPSTWVTLLTGAGFLAWRSRRRLATPRR